MKIEYLASNGNIQILQDGHRRVLNDFIVDAENGDSAKSDLSGESSLVQGLASALWAIPETRATTVHNKLIFNTDNCLVIIDGGYLAPYDAEGNEHDLSLESVEVQAFCAEVWTTKYKRIYQLKKQLGKL